MDLQLKKFLYRLLDATYGALETDLKLRYELRSLRLDHARSRRQNSSGRFTLTAAGLVGALIGLHAILPASIGQRRWLWLSVFAVVGLLYLIQMLVQWRSASVEQKGLEREMSRLSERGEESAAFLQAQISMNTTRWYTASEIAAESHEGADRDKFTFITQDWERRLRKIERKAKKLFERGDLEEAEFNRVLQWLEPFTSAASRAQVTEGDK